MYNCIFTPHCTEMICDGSCPTLVETSYLLERNEISMNSSVFTKKQSDVDFALHCLSVADGRSAAMISSNSISDAELLTYCAICQNWQGSRLHCNVYNLKYSKYIDALKKSWTTKEEPESLEYMQIWSNSAKVLIVSNIDFVKFNDFEAQTLLNLLQLRESAGQTTIVVCPPINELVGYGKFFARLQKVLDDLQKLLGGRRK